jgi:NADH-quinone oxidoreductase subunit C
MMEKKLAKEIATKLKAFSPTNIKVEHDLIFCEINSRDVVKAMKLLHDDKQLAFKVLTDLTAVDYPDQEKRFEIIYNLLSLKNNCRLIVKTYISESDNLDSISSVYNAAVWYEREVWDMFGVIFNNLHDHRRILTDYGFEGHPLRKDFPVTGFVEVGYDERSKKVIYKPVELQQEFRIFDNLSPWHGAVYNLPGDEKAKR